MTEIAVPARPHSGFAHESTKNESVEWFTPKWIFDALGLEFDLDPCSPGQGLSHVPAKRVYTKDDDGLISPWRPGELLFLNPPYGSLTSKFLAKLAHESSANGVEGIALVFARLDTRWYHDYVAGVADCVCFVEGRIPFLQGSLDKIGGAPGAGSMLVAYGPRAAKAVWECNLGHVVPTGPDHSVKRVAKAPEKAA